MSGSNRTENAPEVGEHANEPSSPATTLGVALVNNVLELLECPVCWKGIYPPIYQCSNGHALCSMCKPKVRNQCPICRSVLGNIRCLALEKLAASLMVQCKYESSGCVDKHPYWSILEHEQDCSFRSYKCPYADQCPVVGDIPQLVAHFKANHRVRMHNSRSIDLVYKNPNGLENVIWDLAVYICFGQFFCLHFEVFQFRNKLAPVYLAFLQIMGEDNEAKRYRYSLEVANGERRLIWEGIPQSIRRTHRELRYSQSEGLIIQQNMALSLSCGDKKELNLHITGEIWKKQ